MTQTKKAKNAIIFGSVFGLIAVAFAILYQVHVIKSFDAFLTCTYISYFVGLACFYLASYCKEKDFKKSRTISMFAGFVFTFTAIVLLVYGCVTGNITFFTL